MVNQKRLFLVVYLCSKRKNNKNNHYCPVKNYFKDELAEGNLIILTGHH